MPLSIVRNDITKMNTEAIVNTANEWVMVGEGCDTAIYNAAGYDKLLKYREKHIGERKEGDVFITPGFNLKAKYIIHAVSPAHIEGVDKEPLLRKCYQDSLMLAAENKIKSIAFPLISTGSFGYPKEEGMRIAVDEINAFLLKHKMDVVLVVYDDVATRLGRNLFPDLQSYIDSNYSEPQARSERFFSTNRMAGSMAKTAQFRDEYAPMPEPMPAMECEEELLLDECDASWNFEGHEDAINARLKHLTDTFSEYLMYLIEEKGLENATVYKKAIVDKKIFSKIKNNPDYHPNKLTALCLCVGAGLNLDETKDLLARAGYALSPCDKTDVIFSYFIENGIYDMIELDIQLEEHGLPCVIK